MRKKRNLDGKAGTSTENYTLLQANMYRFCTNIVEHEEKRKKGNKGTKLRETFLWLQANQEKLSRMLGSINAMFLMCFRLSKLHEAGKMSHADASMVKAWTTLRGGLPARCIAW